MTMTAPRTDQETLPSEDMLRREAPRILRRLNEPGACLAIADDMDKAVVVREMAEGDQLKTAVIDRPIAEAMALKEWITIFASGRIARYRISAVGRSALKRFLAEEEARRTGMAEDPTRFAAQHGAHGSRDINDGKDRRRRVRYNAAESPLQSLSRRRDKDGQPFLAPDLVAAGERIREDFELAQLGPRVTQNWDRFLTGGARGTFDRSAAETGSDAARRRVAAALDQLGPGLGDVVLRCCCFLEGMEAVEQRMGWSARSGKIVLRIALSQLKRHYDTTEGGWSPLIG